MNKKYTPMMNHYLEIKEMNPDAIIFYRLGDFYEMFFEDAKVVSSELDLVLTGRSAGEKEKVPMCGVPHHSANSYIQRLIQKGYKVAIVEQLEDAALAKGLVKRDVVKIITPGTIMEDNNDEKNSIYIASLYDYQYGVAVVLCDMMSGLLKGQIIEKNIMQLQKVLLGNTVKEIIIPDSFDKKLLTCINSFTSLTVSYENNLEIQPEYQSQISKVDDIRITKSFAILSNYLTKTQRKSVEHLRCLEMIDENEYLKMDYNTKQNLELISPIKEKSSNPTLWSFMDRCQSAMGSRLLKRWIEYPLIHKNEIEKRLHTIAFLNDNFIRKDELKNALSQIYDMERLIARIAYGNANPRDVLRISKTLEQVPQILSLVKDCKWLSQFHDVNDCMSLYHKINGILVENPPLTLKEGGIFVDGYNEELDALRAKSRNGKKWILDFEAREKERTKIKSLKVGYNKVFGYFIEVTKANIPMIQESFGYIRKQTMTNAERYVTEELKMQEEEILHAHEKSIQMELTLFEKLLSEIKEYLNPLYDIAMVLANVDCLYALAEVSSENGYTPPIFKEEHKINIVEGRHPILEKIMKKGNRYVSNHLQMHEDQDIMIITGPNMGGKSTFMRQSALIAIMAQIGCYVPAKKAELPIFDQIFTRIGASDDIMSGQSTFMVEMMEANYALQNATKNSFIIFDEIGRGTSTYDGMALAQSMIEYIEHKIQAKTLFSTHYHELTNLENHMKKVVNTHVEVHEENGNVTFLYRVMEGKVDKSYGINVAKLAHLPQEVLQRATSILKTFEKEKVETSISKEQIVEVKDEKLEAIKQVLQSVDENKMTPIEALLFVQELKKKL